MDIELEMENPIQAFKQIFSEEIDRKKANRSLSWIDEDILSEDNG